MSYPRIYSLSTVGILRHYNQDYLIHETRTDFTGSNGIGKSMIADLLQIVFIPDSKLIKFGTEGINDQRCLSNLPHEASEAYIFLNIELNPDRFITLGTCISQNKRKPPVSFLVLNDADPYKKQQDLSYSGDCIPLHTHFIDDGRIIGSKDLAKHFRDNYGLYLTTYATREKKHEFFSFLYNKEILPINLSIEDNFKAFAKVIQSFSRAKALDVNDSKSLKDFLLEDEAAYDKSFTQHKEDLQRLLQDYKRLDDDINALEQKQLALKDLKELEQIFKYTHKTFFTLDYQLSVQAMNAAKEVCVEAKQELDETRQNIKRLEDRLPRFERLLTACGTQIANYKKALDILVDYGSENKELQRIQSEVSELIAAGAPKIDQSTRISQEGIVVNVAQLEHREILVKLAEFKTIYQRYGSFTAIESQYNQQYEIVEEQKQSLQSDIQQLQKWVDMLSSDKGLLAKVMERREDLSEKQESALFHLLDVHWQKPDKAKEGARFTEDLEVLNINNIEIDEKNGGFWLKLGHLKEFLPKRQERLLGNSETFDEVLNNRSESFKAKLEKAKVDLNELTMFQRGEVSVVSFLQLDQDLRDATSFRHVRESAIVVQNLEIRLNSMRSQEQVTLGKLQELAKQIPFTVKAEDIDKQLLDKQKNLDAKERRKQNIYGAKERESTKLDTLLNSDQPRQAKQLESDEDAYLKAELTYHEKENDRLKLDFQIDFDECKKITDKDLGKLEVTFDDAKTKYCDRYRDISAQFQESSSGQDPEIKEQIEDKRYEFLMLEHILLGSKIKYADSLPSVLRESNRQREDIIKSIHSSMLKIFSDTKEKFDSHHRVVRGLNNFFRGKKISGKYTFQINFTKRNDIDIDWINSLNTRLLNVHQLGGLPIGESVDNFVEDFLSKSPAINETLMFKNYLTLKHTLTSV